MHTRLKKIEEKLKNSKRIMGKIKRKEIKKLTLERANGDVDRSYDQSFVRDSKRMLSVETQENRLEKNLIQTRNMNKDFLETEPSQIASNKKHNKNQSQFDTSEKKQERKKKIYLDSIDSQFLISPREAKQSNTKLNHISDNTKIPSHKENLNSKQNLLYSKNIDHSNLQIISKENSNQKDKHKKPFDIISDINLSVEAKSFYSNGNNRLFYFYNVY